MYILSCVCVLSVIFVVRLIVVRLGPSVADRTRGWTHRSVRVHRARCVAATQVLNGASSCVDVDVDVDQLEALVAWVVGTNGWPAHDRAATR